MNLLRRLALGFAIVWMLVQAPAHLCAQSTFGTVRGSAVDQSGAGVPGAVITLHGVDENTNVMGLSDERGTFAFENLKPGHYKITVAKDGFTTAAVNQLELTARQTLRVDVPLTVASQVQSVEVAVSAESVNTENATLADSKKNADITALPLNSRAVSTSPLAALATSPSVVKDSQGNVSVGGAVSSQVGFSVDGISTASVRSNGALQDAYPSSEGIQEMKVTAFNNNAEFSQVGDVTFITKSGTNQFHGSLFEYLQNDAMDATIFNFPAKAPKRFNTFGGSLGGPITIPRYNGKDRTFFFFDYEGNRRRTSVPQQLLVPTQAERNGDLSALVAAYGSGPVTNPFTGQAYANNTIPTGVCQGCINPVAQKLLTYYPLPNANLNVINPSYNYQTLAPIPSNTDGWDLRVDQTISSKQQVYARYSWKNVAAQLGGNGMLANQFLPNVSAHDQNRSFLVSYNYSITPSSINEFRFGFTNFQENDGFPIQGGSAISQLGLQGIDISQHPTGSAFPTFNFSDGSISPIGQDRTGTTISKTTQFTDNFSHVVNRHTLRFGVDVRKVRYNALMFFQPSDDYGAFTFSPGLFTNYAFGDLLLGVPQSSFFAITSPQIDARTTQWGVYAQDEWQVNSHLTVSAGLRWEMLPPFAETQGDLGSFDPRNNSVLVPSKFLDTAQNNPAIQTVYNGFLASFNACSLPGRNTSLACSNVLTSSQDGLAAGLRKIYWKDFDPRISVAYRPFRDNKTVIRAGFGIFTMTTLGPMSFNNAGNPTSDLTTNVNAVYNANGVLQAPLFQFPLTAPKGQGITYGGGSLEQANDPLFRDAQSAQWNVTLERQLDASTLLRVSYLGMNSYRMPVTVDWNQIRPSTTPYTVPAGAYVDPRAPYQNWFLLMSSENLGFSNYQALQTEVRHSISHGLSFQANYTWAKNISDAQGSGAPSVFAAEEAYAAEVTNRFNIAADRGNVVGTPRQRLLITGIYQLPFGAGRTWLKSGVLSYVLGGWNLSTITTLQTGQWLTPTINPTGSNSYDPSLINDQSNTNVANRTGAFLRPDCVGNPIPQHQGPGGFYNINAFTSTPPGAGRFGSCGLGILQGPGMIDVDLGLAKVFQIREGVRLRLEGSFTNALNHLNFAPPATNISNPSTFGVLQAVLPQGSGGNRVGQVSLRLDF
ncbi:MAG TPA: carboxypeptidase regulatory-like domain-containing protein [Bryobacteraceae bacterium]|nr:carboxypeptidase regulatory-like domain-containing protein [Bryobacteraceae bacterium]